MSQAYELEPTTGGAPVPLAALFGEHSQLIIYHLMLGDEDKEACHLCSFFIDQYNGCLVHLQPRTALAVVADAQVPVIKAATAQKGWNMPLFSAAGGSFGKDFGVSELQSNAYNYTGKWPYGPRAPGLSVFKKDEEGNVFHTCAFCTLNPTP